MSGQSPTKAKLYKRYPISSLFIYNGTTILHFLLGGLGIIYGYNRTPLSLAFGISYIVFVAVLGLMIFRIFVIFPKIACLHCYAKFQCPQAEQMDVREL